MKRRRFTAQGHDPASLPPDDGSTEADTADPDTQRIERLREMMGEPKAPRPHISTRRALVAQGRSHKAKPPELEPIGRELTKLWKKLETLQGDEARRPIRQRIRDLDAQYFAARAALPEQEQPSGFAFLRRWKGRVYRVDPKGISAMHALAIYNHIMPGGLACSDGEARDRFLVYLWCFRKRAAITVGVALSMGKPKVQCSGCGTIRLAWNPWKPEIKSECRSCDTKSYKSIDAAAMRPGSDRPLHISQREICQRFRVTRGHLCAAILRYSPPDVGRKRRQSAVSTEVPPNL
jgi:hypothetical protein